jgi:hypothetical protein
MGDHERRAASRPPAGWRVNEIVVTARRGIRAARHRVDSHAQAVALARALTSGYIEAGLKHLNPADLDAGRAVLVGRSSVVWILTMNVGPGPDDPPPTSGNGARRDGSGMVP